MKIEKVWLTDTAVWIRTDEGKEACELFADYPRLRYATKEQLIDFTTDEFGIHWENLNEDLSFEGFFNKQQPTALYQLFMAHPELNVSALARRMGISQSLMAQYISGKKNASKARMALILDTIHTMVMLPKMVGEIARKPSKTGLSQRRQKAYLCSAS